MSGQAERGQPEQHVDWNEELRDQLAWHWENQLRPRLDGLTDEEYVWEPVEDCWSVRPRGEAVTEMAAGGGESVVDFAFPAPEPAPVTTIAWRLAHLIVGVFGMRVATHFGGPPIDFASHHYAPTAAGALAQLDEQYAAWMAGVRGLSEAELARPCGEGPPEFAERTMATLVLHIHREVLHHGAEIALLRDLYAAGRR